MTTKKETESSFVARVSTIIGTANILQQTNLDDEFMNFLMDGFGSESYFNFEDLEHGTISPMANNDTVAGPGTSAAALVPDTTFTDADWSIPFKEIDSNDLVTDSLDIFGIKSMTRSIMENQSPSNTYANTTVGSFAELTPATFGEVLVHVKQEVPVEAPTKKKPGRRPKSTSISDNASPISTTRNMELRDVKPSASALKRAFDEDSNMSFASVSGKKVKKYMQDPADPSVKNARAAKLNRDKKKQEVESLKTELKDSKEQIEKLMAIVATTSQQVVEMKRENEAVRAKYLACNGLRGVTPSIRDFLTSIIPPLQETYGRFNVEFSEVFDEVSASVPNVAGQENFLENPSQVFTTHVDMNNRRIRVDYDPCAPHLTSVLCSDADFLNNGSPAAG